LVDEVFHQTCALGGGVRIRPIELLLPHVWGQERFGWNNGGFSVSQAAILSLDQSRHIFDL
jgi:hypothetical protein